MTTPLEKKQIAEHDVELFSQYDAMYYLAPLSGDITTWSMPDDEHGNNDCMFTIYDYHYRTETAPLDLPVVEWASYSDRNPYALDVKLNGGRIGQILTVIIFNNYSERSTIQFRLNGENVGDPIELHNRNNKPDQMQIVTNPPGFDVNGFQVVTHGIYSPVIGPVSTSRVSQAKPLGHHHPERPDWRKAARLQARRTR